jgi:hypothetical protein
LRSPKVDWLDEREKTESGVREYGEIVESGVVDLSSVTAYYQLEAVFHLSEALNILLSQSLQAATPPGNQVNNHVRVIDISSLELKEEQLQERQGKARLHFRSGFQTHLGEIIRKSAVCRVITHLMLKLPLIDVTEHGGPNSSSRILSVMLKKMQLAVCALLATFLSAANLAKSVLENDGVEAWKKNSTVDNLNSPPLAPTVSCSVFYQFSWKCICWLRKSASTTFVVMIKG